MVRYRSTERHERHFGTTSPFWGFVLTKIYFCQLAKKLLDPECNCLSPLYTADYQIREEQCLRCAEKEGSQRWSAERILLRCLIPTGISLGLGIDCGDKKWAIQSVFVDGWFSWQSASLVNVNLRSDLMLTKEARVQSVQKASVHCISYGSEEVSL